MNIMHSCINFSVFIWSCLAFFDAILAYGSHYSLYIFFKLCQILILIFEMGNVVYDSFVIKAMLL